MESHLSPKLEAHCRAVAWQAEALARRWGASPDDAAVAGLLHDICRHLGRQEVLDRARNHGLTVGDIDDDAIVPLLHARVAAAELADRGFSAEVVEAVSRHTLGGPAMSLLDECVFVADGIAPGRTWKGVDEVRRRATESLDAAALDLVRRDLERLRRQGREPQQEMLALQVELTERLDEENRGAQE
ncbi:MAG TPA: bis(5'-nucleosyl)-tetraphosphatase (symmetrical) YqeK [Thermoleophilia bacterium]|nr:bis(5'-nucleosyl)-tetraphosphatase (symmetrical) YqeK [Thermoleophilia bacterium]